MVNIRNRVTSRIPERSTRSAKFAALGAGFGALFSRKLAIVFAGFGAYFGSRLGERSESNVLLDEEETVEVEGGVAEEDVDEESEKDSN